MATQSVSSGLQPIREVGFATTHASPAVRLLARELGVDLSLVRGSGPNGRITPQDVKESFGSAPSDSAMALNAPERV